MHLLNTRPEGRAAPLTQALQAAGHVVSELPLLQLVRCALPKVQVQGWQQAGPDEAVVVVSSLAAREGLQQLGVGPKRQWLAVGAVTGRILQEAGLDVLVPEQENSEGLLALPPLQQAKCIWLWRGAGGRELLIDTAAQRQQALVDTVLYQRQPHPEAFMRWQQILQTRGMPDRVLLTSLLGSRLWQGVAGARWMEPQLWVIGARIWGVLAAQAPDVRGRILPDLQPATVLAALAHEAACGSGQDLTRVCSGEAR